MKNNTGRDNFQAVHWTTNEGLSNPDATSILKDFQGFMWFGTSNGLNRFDGKNFKYFFPEKTKPGTIGGKNIYGITEDSLHFLWVGTESGISRYNHRTDSFTNFHSDSGRELDHLIIPFWATKNEVLCMDYRQYAIVAYNIHSFEKSVKLFLKPEYGLSKGSVKFQYSIFEEKSNHILMLAEDVGELLDFNLNNGEKKSYQWPRYHKVRAATAHLGAEAMRLDRNKNAIWINTPQGLIKFSLKDKTFEQIPALIPYLELPNYDRFVGVDIDPKGRIWFATQPTGILIYNPADGSVQRSFPNDSAVQMDAGESNACLYCDRDGIIWTGSWFRTGIYQLASFTRTVQQYVGSPEKKNYLSHNSVLGFVQGEKDDVWISTIDGVDIFSPVTGAFKVLKKPDLPGMNKSTNNNNIVAIHIDTIRKIAWLWADSIYKMDITTRKCTPVKFVDSLGKRIYFNRPPDFFALEFFDGGLIWAHHHNRESIFLFKETDTVAHELLSFPEGQTLPHIQPLTNGILLIGLQPDAATHLSYQYQNGKIIRIHTLLDTISWSETFYNKEDQTYWVTSDRQLLHLTSAFKPIRLYTTDDGFPQLDVSSLTIDNNRNLWFHTERSIHSLNTRTGAFFELSAKDGFEKMGFVNFPGGFKSSNGDIYFPTGWIAQGFARVTPNNHAPALNSSVYFSSIEVNQKPVNAPEGINALNQLSLDYDKNTISLKTGNIDYYSRGSGKIRYKLEYNKDSAEWQYAPSDWTIIYTALQPGSYKLTAEASNIASQFTGQAKTLMITISPAFWNTWWFRLTAIIFLALGFYGIVRARLKSKFSLALERSEKERQIAAMHSKASELEMQALRAQMNPHFIFNSLNSINRFILQNNKAQASEYLTKFSKLVRLILQNSQASLITLESEMDSLELYLNLETLRFNYHFDYKVTFPKDMDISVLKVPPLILQPYVENAIWHGLMHKEEKGLLTIEVIEMDEHLYFIIADNGVGRKQSAALASKSATKHKSMGLRITAHRIAMLQNSESMESPVKIRDLEYPDGSAAGTEVTIKMPVIYD